MIRRPTATSLLVLSALLTGVLTACSSADARPTVRVLVTARASHAPTLIADEEGFFEDEGITVELVNLDSARKAVPLLVQGDLDVWGGTLNAGLVNAFLAGEEVRIVADKGALLPGSCTYYGLMAAADLATTGPPTADTLRGKRFAVDLSNTVSQYIGDAILESVGLTREDVELFDLDATVAMESLLRGRVDTALISEPRITTGLGRGLETWLPGQDVVPGYPVGLLVFGPTLLDGDPDLGVRFMTAYLRGVRQYNEGKTARNLEILADRTKTPIAELEEQCLPPISGDGSVDPTGLEGALRWAHDHDQLDGPVAPEDLMDDSFVREANQRLGAVS